MITETKVFTHRAKRFPIQATLRYRIQSEHTWHIGVIENVSTSGLLFRGEHSLVPGTQIEMSFNLPGELGSEAGAKVICHGAIVRSAEYQMLAASISRSRLLRP